MTPASSMVRQWPKGKPAWLTSASVTRGSTSRAWGPHSPKVVHDDVRSVTWADPSAGRWSLIHFFSVMPVPAPVTTRKWSVPRRMIVRSDLKPPSSLRNGRVDDAPDGDVHLGDGEVLQRGERAGAGDVEHHERREVDQPARSRAAPGARR